MYEKSGQKRWRAAVIPSSVFSAARIRELQMNTRSPCGRGAIAAVWVMAFIKGDIFLSILSSQCLF